MGRGETGSARDLSIAIIAAQYPFSGRVPLVPPILEYLAALTLREQSDADITLVDANQRSISPDEIRSDVVAISAMTATVTWAYWFADECRKRGKHVVLGGIHPTALPEEAALHADTVVIGEAESVWGQVLQDLRSGRAGKFYRGERLPLAGLPRPIDGKLKGNYQFRAFFTARGCPYRCTFCSVRRFFGDTIRYRPIPEVVAEVEACAGKVWFNGDDNIWGGDTRRSTELFNELARGTKRRWYGFGDLRSVQTPQGERMLNAARESGLFSVWVGWESDDAHLRAFNASGKQGADRVAAVKRMQDAGIDVTLFVVLGGRQDSLDSFKRTLELSDRLNVGVHPVLLTPLPGTELYEEYKPYLLPGLGWDSFIGVKSVFEHPAPEMTPVRRELEYHHLVQQLFSFRRILKRIAAIPRAAFPATHLLSFMMQMPMKIAFGKAYSEWKAELRRAGGRGPERSRDAQDRGPVPSLGDKILGAIRTIKLRKISRYSFWTFAASVAVISGVHALHDQEPEMSSTLDRLNASLHLAEEILLGVLMAVAAVAILARIFNLAGWVFPIWRIASDKIDRLAIVLKELAFSTLLGGGIYWAYICMADLL